MMTFLTRYGALTVFTVMFLEQAGLPIPAVPVLLAAGALIGSGQLNWFVVLGLAVAGSLGGDWIWYELGRRRGAKILGMICKISMEPDTCVRRTENTFVRYGVRTLLAAKFLPGFNRVAPPLAGIFNIPLQRFILFDGLGALAYSAVFVILGRVFHAQVENLLLHLAKLGKWAGLVIGSLLAAYILFKYMERQWMIRQLRIARITPEELRTRIDGKEKPVIIDLRSELDLTALPYLIPGAIHMLPEKIDARHQEIPRDRDVVVYCSCPNEVTSARVAMKLRRRGITRIRPLLGGINSWRYLEYTLEPVSPSAD